MLYVTTFTPYNLTCRVLPAPDANIYAKYPHSFDNILLKLDTAFLPYERVLYDPIPACTSSQNLWPLCITNNSISFLISPQIPAIDNRKKKINYKRCMFSQSPKLGRAISRDPLFPRFVLKLVMICVKTAAFLIY